MKKEYWIPTLKLNKMKKIEWESIDESLFKEANVGECVQVSMTEDYINAMRKQNIDVLDFLRKKYPDRRFRLSKWHSHDFGQYQEVEEGVYVEDDEDDDYE